MASGVPTLLSGDNEAPIKTIRPITFARDDQASFDETLLQRIVDQTPEILPIRDFYPSVSSVCSLGREIPVDLGERQGFIDNLLVTNDGHLVLVETKLYRNPEALREAIIQTLQYGMAVNNMPLLELESRARRGDKSGIPLRSDETIRDRVFSRVEQGLMRGVSDSFEDALARYQRTGEMLLLVVADGIHTSVERITNWMNEQGSSTPIQFGLVELRFYELPDGQRVVVPKTLLKTREVSRHVVIVDIRNESTSSASASVTDEFQAASGGALRETRTVKSAAPTMTKSVLLETISAEDLPVVTQLLDQLESIGLDQNARGPTVLRYGITYPQEGGEFLPLLYLHKRAVWVYFPKRLQEVLGTDGMNEFRSKMNQIATFWREDQLTDPYSGGCEVKYRLVGGRVQDIISILEDFKLRAINALNDEASKS